MTKNSLLKSFFRFNSIITIGNVLVSLKSIILLPIIIKSVGVSAYGAFVLLSSILGIIYGISNFGAGFRAQRFLPSTNNIIKKQKLFYEQFYFQIISISSFALIYVVFKSKIDYFFFNNEISYSSLLVPAYLISFAIYSQASFYFRFTSRINYMTVIGVCFAYLDIGIIFLSLFFFEKINVSIFIFSQVISSIIIIIPSFTIILREIGIKASFYKFNELIADIKLGFPLTLNFIVEFILSGSDRYLIALYLSVSDVGIYNPAYMIGSLIIIFPKAMGGALPQLLSKAVDSNKDSEAYKLIDYSLKSFIIIAIPYIAGSIIFGEKLLLILANNDVAQGGYKLIPIVALGTFFYGANLILSNILFVKMKTKKIFKMNLIASFFNLVFNVILLFIFKSIIVAAISTLISYFIAFIYISTNVIKEWKINFQLSVITKSTIASLIMIFSLSLLKDNFSVGFISLLLQVALGVFIYALTLLIIKTFSKEEIDFLKNILKK